MLISKKWLQSYFVDDLPSARTIADTLLLHSFEIEGLEPSQIESVLLEMSETEINNIFQSNTRHSSLDAPVHEAEDVAMGDLLQGSEETDEDVMVDILYDLSLLESIKSQNVSDADNTSNISQYIYKKYKIDAVIYNFYYYVWYNIYKYYK